MTRPEHTPFVPADIGGIVTVGSPALSPDSSTVAYVVTRVDLSANTYRRSLWLADVAGASRPRQLTSDQFSDTQPAWSPDGSLLAFVSSGRHPDIERKFGLHVMPVTAPGETITIATSPDQIENISWSRDGSRLLYVSRISDDGARDGRDPAQRARRIDGLDSRVDNVGWIVSRPRQISVVDASGRSRPEQLTRGRTDSYDAAWSPDGSRIAFVSARQQDADLTRLNDVWVMDVGQGRAEPTAVTETDGTYRLPSFSPDGTRLAFYQSRDPHGGHVGYRHAVLAVADLAAGSRVVVTGDLDRTLLTDGSRPPLWRDSFIVLAEDHGAVPLLAIADDGSARRLVEGDRAVRGYDVSADGRTVACTITSLDLASELYIVQDGRERRVSENQPRDRPVGNVTRFRVPSEDGCELDAWLVLPPDAPAERESRTVPLLLSVHGGPSTQYSNSWLDEFALLAGAGFAVLFTNPHGSTGGSEHFARKILSPSAEPGGTGWGQIDYRDLLRVLDAALERFPILDRDRLGVLGGSYGGYMTSWMVSHTHRFAAACSERAANNLASLEWSCDLAGRFSHNYGSDSLANSEEIRLMSPVTYVNDIDTPLLIVHSDNDMRCPPEQADSLYVPLRRLGKHVEYWRFPGTSHELSRSGPPRLRIERAELIIEWFDRWLRPTRAEPAPA
jgi:dipeptidyl aminopeptidase/acylaminoacyl peptidase